MLKNIFSAALIALISLPVLAADKDDECYNYKSSFEVNGKKISEKEFNKLPKSMQYQLEKAGKVNRKPLCDSGVSKNVSNKNVAVTSPNPSTPRSFPSAPYKKPAVIEETAKLPAELKNEKVKTPNVSNSFYQSDRQPAAPLKTTNIKTAEIAGIDSAPMILTNEPVMVVRFNQANVYFETPLQNIIVKTLEVKPDARFEIDSLIASSGDNTRDIDNKQLAAETTRKIAEVFNGLGLGPDRYSINQKGDGTVKSNEFRMFVR